MSLLIIILIILLLWVAGPWISRWIRSYAMGKMEDWGRRQMGMPTRAEEKRARKAREKEEKAKSGKQGGWRERFRQQSTRGRGGDPAADIRMMKEYAVDVEYVEIHEYSETIVFEQDKAGKREKIVLESQVSDAEYIVI